MKGSLAVPIMATEIHLHLTSGQKRAFYQENVSLIKTIFDDLHFHIFARTSQIIVGNNEAYAFPGTALIGISFQTTLFPGSFIDRETVTGTVIRQIEKESFLRKRSMAFSFQEGAMNSIISEVEFSTGKRIYLEASEIIESPIDTRSNMHHLFKNPCLFCRRLQGGFSIWNTAQIVSWTHYPALNLPNHSWQAELMPELAMVQTKSLALH